MREHIYILLIQRGEGVKPLKHLSCRQQWGMGQEPAELFHPARFIPRPSVAFV